MEKLFGTDGIRGRANAAPMTCDIALKAGRAVGAMVRDAGKPRLVIGRDPRVSGDMLTAALAAGAASAGVHVGLAGVIPTPGVAFLTSSLPDVGAGIVVSASHNPYHDNGIKIFRQGGLKLTDDQEARIEAWILSERQTDVADVGTITEIPDALDRYAEFLLEKFSTKAMPSRIRLVVDAANGAAHEVCHRVFHSGLFDAVFIHDVPDGFNINRDCGSQHIESLRDQVKLTAADLGIALDGDADRMIAVDDQGNEITGDRILAICASHARSSGTLKNNRVVSTIMSNIGLCKSLAEQGIELIKTGVGDRRVLEEMHRCGAIMGGEDSGHMIFLEDHTTGDGLLSALKLIDVMRYTGRPLSDLARVMTVFPQVLMNVPVDASRPDFNRIPAIAQVIRQVESQLAETGRVLVRYSGTQPFLRVMVEGPDPAMTQRCCDAICRAIRENISG